MHALIILVLDEPADLLSATYTSTGDFSACSGFSCHLWLHFLLAGAAHLSTKNCNDQAIWLVVTR